MQYHMNKKKISFSANPLVLTLSGNDMFALKGKNSLIPFVLKESANRWEVYPMINPIYVRDDPDSINMSFIIVANRTRPIMLWVNVLWFEIDRAKEKSPKNMNNELWVFTYTYKKTTPTIK